MEMGILMKGGYNIEALDPHRGHRVGKTGKLLGEAV